DYFCGTWDTSLSADVF
nr:immunoglobulin light chain junction region [Macaca mulatta]MOX13520.1 immunoglobulin light chain junction region [Macaca mulatta]MOX13777.1 immunoglobulin light chain junction region [Macaca mulatta]